MEVIFRHRVEYAVKNAVPVQEVIDTLVANQRIASDLGGLMEALFDGLRVEKVELRVDEISFGSLRELFFVALFITYQEELKKEIPPLIEAWIGLPVDGLYDALITVCTKAILFYGADYAYRRFTNHHGSPKLKAALEKLVAQLATHTDKSREEIREILKRHLAHRGRMKEAAKAAVRFFRPSRNQANAEIRIGEDRLIPSDVISEVPNSVNLSELDWDDYRLPYNGVRINVRAKDHDKDGAGWAGRIDVITEKRLPLELYPHVPRDYVWKNDVIWADVLATFRRRADAAHPIDYQVVNVYDRYPGPGVDPLSDPEKPED